jgi:hypothetical protein
MNKLDRQKKIKGLFDSKFFMVFLLIMAFVFGKSAFYMYEQKSDTKKMVASVRGEFDGLDQRYKDAQGDLNFMNSNTGREKEIREKFDLGREGEKAIFIVDEKMSTSTEEKKGGFGGFLTKVRDLFGI